MNLLQEVQKMAVIKRLPEIRTGYTVRIHQKIKEGDKQRIQLYEGLVIRINSGYGADKTITVRKVVDGIGVEKILPLHSTNIEKIEVIKTSKVRQARLYYMRERFGKSARMKDTLVSAKVQAEAMAEQEAQYQADVDAETAKTADAAETVETTEETEVVETPEVAETPEAEATEEEKSE